MTSKERRVWTGSAVVSSIIAAAISFTVVKGLTRSAYTATVDERLTKVVNELKPALPKKIDELTTLIACARSAASRASIARQRDCAATEVTIVAMTKSSTAAQISDGFVIVSE